jgi:lipoprotein-releasing system ATP-binding protein
MSHLIIKELSKGYQDGEDIRWVLHDLNFIMEQGSFISIMGSSGAGKSSFLNCVGALDTFQSGSIDINGFRITNDIDREQLVEIRKNMLSFIFQNHYLMPDFSVLENTIIPLMVKGVSKKEARKIALDTLEKVGIANRASALPAEISGGESQRAAVARALVGNPALILADEPTGNLDEANTNSFIELLRELKESEQLSIIVVTHEQRLADAADQKYELAHGKLSQID